jgi:hypothetical protein
MTSGNGESEQPHAPLELSDVLNIELHDGAVRAFEVVGILEDPQDRVSYAVLRDESARDEEHEFIVTDLQGNLVEEEPLAQEILDDFLAFADDDGERAERNGEPG